MKMEAPHVPSDATKNPDCSSALEHIPASVIVDIGGAKAGQRENNV
ncbi:MAG: hypothetical protein NTX53_19225 [candidate division WOR-3 bacterium]|nr:hypothetical protein [candidate division WOR-3 bacterium]